ncbi:MAG: hybrid sensor histidine kinase/response regulator [Cyanobacteriota bacterium]|nr:hybrid sensor histidine kinase/response regulator [Cyanobacteriota bacterium]
MTNDPTIREQSYRYFLQEAPELMQVLEQDLLSLQEGYSINKVHNLMRTTHTLKGAAASVGLETIKTVAHYLEDIFKAICQPDLSIDPEVEALLFEGYECLRLPLAAELTGGQVNEVEILDRTAVVFAQLQEKLGDCFDQEGYLPTSVELGFDLTQSIFEVGVTQRLDELTVAIASSSAEEVATLLRTQAEVFLGLAESLNLPGFRAIAQTAIMALDIAPDQGLTIAQTALADFQAGQTAVLNGDRTQGGEPSLTLQQLAGLITVREEEEQIQQLAASVPDAPVEAQESFASAELNEVSGATDIELNLSDSHEAASRLSELPHLESSLNESHHEDSTNLNELHHEDLTNLSESHNEDLTNELLEVIWGGEAVIDSLTSDERNDLTSANSFEREKLNSSDRAFVSEPLPAAAANSTRWSPTEPEVRVKTRPIPTSESTTPNPNSQKEQIGLPRTVRVNVEHLEYLNYSIGELLTNQNRQALQNEQLQAAVRILFARLQQHQQLLDQLQDWSDHQFNLPQLRGSWGEILPRISNPPHPLTSSLTHGFDALELDRYSESQLLVQSILEDTVQLTEATEAIDLFASQSSQTLEKQRRMLLNTRDTLMEARMLPLGDIFGRFPRVLQQLEVLHDKPVTLELRGTEVLVDKVVVEKLYGPLLHLVRNAFAHGIEPIQVRQQQGKPPKGLIEIRAYHRGRLLVIEVRDDGQGLDFEQIRQQVVERQLVSPEGASRLNEAQLTDFLFEPGFSTTSEVNDLSGRGIGLDMVKAQLQALQGSMSVYSQPQQGTTFVLQIPLSLTIAKLLLAQAGSKTYALLADAIEQILIPQAEQIRSWEGGKVLRWGNGDAEQLIPIHQLSNVLDYASGLPEPSVPSSKYSVVPQEQVMPVVLIRCQDKLLGLEVDQLLGEQELVIRPLGSTIAPPSYIYGGSILADGRLTLVLDGAVLMESLCNQQAAGSSKALPGGYGADTPYYAIATRDVTDSTPPRLNSRQQQRLLPAPTTPNRARLEKRILVVDDSITVRQTLVLTLQKAGYQVLQAKDGYEAIEQLQHQTDIQLVICDIEMPRMNGFEFLKHRQQDRVLADIPVVMLTSRSASKHRLIASELGATGYLTKPYIEHELLVMVTDVIEENKLNSISV